MGERAPPTGSLPPFWLWPREEVHCTHATMLIAHYSRRTAAAAAGGGGGLTLPMQACRRKQGSGKERVRAEVILQLQQPMNWQDETKGEQQRFRGMKGF